MKNFKQLENLKSWDSIAKYCYTDVDKICHKKSFKEHVCKHILNFSGYNTEHYNFLYDTSTFCTIISKLFEYIHTYKLYLKNTDQYYLNVEKNDLIDIIKEDNIRIGSYNYIKRIQRLNELKNFLNFNNYKFELTSFFKEPIRNQNYSFDNKIDVLEL